MSDARHDRRTWWSRRFLEAVESGDADMGLEPGHRYAKQDAVHDLKVHPGEVLAEVRASHTRPHQVSLITAVLDEEQWSTVTAALAGQPLFCAPVLAGELLPEVERVFDVLGLRLFPRGPQDLAVACSCPGREQFCEHAAAVLHMLAQELDGDPFLLPAWLGKRRGEFLAQLRRSAEHGRAIGAESSPSPFTEPACPPYSALPPLSASPGEFWSSPKMPFVPSVPSRPDPAILVADPPEDGQTCTDLVGELTPLYERLAGDRDVP